MGDTIKPTFDKPISNLSKGYQKSFDKSMTQNHVKLNETDELLSEVEQSLKKKIFSLAKMEALVFSDPKLSAVYEEMSVNGEEKYGYHYNETIMNMLFNDYVLDSPKYLQKYKQAIPKEKKRRDKSGINQLKKSGEEKMHTNNFKPKKLAPTGLKPVTEGDEQPIPVIFLVNEKDPKNPDLFAYFPEENYDRRGVLKMGYSHIGQHSAVHPSYADEYESREATPKEYKDLQAELEGLGYNLDVLNGQDNMEETTGSGGGGGGTAFNGSGQYTDKLSEETTTTSVAGGASYVGYAGPAAFSPNGDLMHAKGKAKAKVKTVPMIKGGTIIQESKNYLINADGFEKYFNSLNEDFERENSPMKDTPSVPVEISVGLWDKTAPGKGIAAKSPVGTDTKRADDIIDNNSSEFTSGAVNNWSKEDKEIELDTLKTGQLDKPNLETVEESNNIQEMAVSKRQRKFMGMVDAVQKGKLSPQKVGSKVTDAAKSMKPKAVKDFASTKEKGLPEKVKPKKINEADDFMKIKKDIGHSPQGADFREENGKKALYFDGQNANAKKWAEDASKKHGIPAHDTNKKKLKEDTQTMIADKQDSMSNKAVATGNQSTGVPMGMQNTGGGMSEGISKEYRNDMIRRIQDISAEVGTMMPTFEFFKNKSDEEVSRIYNELLKKSPSFKNKMGSLLGLQENYNLLEEINNELKAFSIHQDKLKKMTEDRKPSALILRDRVGSENEKNFKMDMKNSSIKDIVDIENELEWKDQQTEIGDNPYELGEKLEKGEIKTTDAKSGEALKNVGNSANDKGDEIPKRNLSKEEQEEVNKYRLGLGDLVYDNEVGERFENRMKSDMGDKLYNERQEKLALRGEAPMYNKDNTRTQTAAVDKVQYDKQKSGWNERVGLKETVVSGKYFDALGKKRIIDFNLNEAIQLTAGKQTGLFEVSLEGLGNIYAHIEKTNGSQLNINENAVNAISKNKFFTDGTKVFVMKNPVQNLNENEQKDKKPAVNEQMNKMKHLVGYNTNDFVKQSKI